MHAFIMVYIIKIKAMDQENFFSFCYFIPMPYFIPPQAVIQEVEMQPIKNQAMTPENKIFDTLLEKSTSFKAKEKETKKTSRPKRNQLEDPSFQVQDSRKKNKSTYQKFGRNSGSHLLRIFAKMLKSSVFKSLFNSLQQKLKLGITLKKFYAYTNSIGINYQKYIKVNKVMTGLKNKPHLGLMVYHLFYIFSSRFARSALLTSHKTQSKNMLPALSQIRKISEQMLQQLKQHRVTDPEGNQKLELSEI